MSFVRWVLAFAAVVLASGCDDKGTEGAGGSSSTSSSSNSSTSSSGSSSSSGTGGAGGGESKLEPSGFSCSGKTPSLTSDVIPITAASCATSASCHLAMQSSSGLYAQLVNQVAEECTNLRLDIKPGDPEHSYVIQKLTGRNLCSGVPMPNGGPMLSTAEIQTIYDWICEGAPQN